MPGIAGFISNSNKLKSKSFLLNLKYFKYHILDNIYEDKKVCIGRCCLPFFAKHTQPVFKNEIYVWLYGEIYNAHEILNSSKYIKFNPNQSAEIFLNLYVKDKDFGFLDKLNGVFAAIIYDKTKQKLFLISDQFGTQFIYYSLFNKGLLFSTKLNTFTKVEDFNIKVNKKAVQEFTANEYLSEKTTWFKDVDLLEHSTILEYDIINDTYNKRKYWDFNRIKISDDDIETASDKMAGLILNAVKITTADNPEILLPLSGGLDSRAIYAALGKKQQKRLITLTIGEPDCEDVLIANKVVNIGKSKNEVFSTQCEKFIQKAPFYVFEPEPIGAYHFHGMEMEQRMLDFEGKRVSLNGFLGDAVLGGFYCVQENRVKKYLNRGRRFILLGPLRRKEFSHSRLCLFEKNLIEYAFSLPDEIIADYKVYSRALLKAFPEYFDKIPKQGANGKTAHHYINENAMLYPIAGAKKAFHDYNKFFRKEKNKKELGEILLNPDACYLKYISKEKVQEQFNQHMQGKNNARFLGNILSLEIWLQQLAGNISCNYISLHLSG